MAKITVTKTFGPGNRSNPKYFGKVEVKFVHGDLKIRDQAGIFNSSEWVAKTDAAKFHTDLNAKGIPATMKGLYTVEFQGGDFNLQHGYGAFPKNKKIRAGTRFFPNRRLSMSAYPKFKIGAYKRGLFPIEALKEEWESGLPNASVIWRRSGGTKPSWYNQLDY